MTATFKNITNKSKGEQMGSCMRYWKRI